MSRPLAFFARSFVFAMVVAAGSAGCSDNSNKLKVQPDAGPDGGEIDAGGGGSPDGGKSDGGTTGTGKNPDACSKDADCAKLTTDCAVGECKAGRCVAAPANEAKSCGADKCTVNARCSAGKCKGQPKDCSALDGDCTKGSCQASTGRCAKHDANEGGRCDDGDLCTVSDVCAAGTCNGVAKDCSALTGGCNIGQCDGNSGDCLPVAADANTPCDDGNPCTMNETCGARGDCNNGTGVTVGTGCNDYNSCTTDDRCDATRSCTGTPTPSGGTCNDDNECTTGETCTNAGTCGNGTPDKIGQACQTACRKSATCSAAGTCDDAPMTSSFNPQCALNWCGNESLCDPSFKDDQTCDCGCGNDGADCNPCSMPMCTPGGIGAPTYKATRQCDDTGKPVTDCALAWIGDGTCDCGCQFQDTDCRGKDCCTDRTTDPSNAGCSIDFVADCVCNHPLNGDPSCCTNVWDATCAAEAKSFGCAICP